jgi:hypothetical protein
MQRREASLVPVVLLLLAAACGGNSGSGDSGTVNCQSDSRVFKYTPNLSVTSTSGMKYILVQSDPAPPARGLDTWTLKITDSAGTPQPSLPVQIRTIMPEHGHGSSTTPVITNQGGGNYQVSQLNLFMPGVWKITFSNSAAFTDIADFWFCVPG